MKCTSTTICPLTNQLVDGLAALQRTQHMKWQAKKRNQLQKCGSTMIHRSFCDVWRCDDLFIYCSKLAQPLAMAQNSTAATHKKTTHSNKLTCCTNSRSVLSAVFFFYFLSAPFNFHGSRSKYCRFSHLFYFLFFDRNHFISLIQNQLSFWGDLNLLLIVWFCFPPRYKQRKFILLKGIA